MSRLLKVLIDQKILYIHSKNRHKHGQKLKTKNPEKVSDTDQGIHPNVPLDRFQLSLSRFHATGARTFKSKYGKEQTPLKIIRRGHAIKISKTHIVVLSS